MARIEGTGIATPSKESSKKATAFLGGFQKKADEKFIKTYERKKDAGIDNSDFETDRYNKLKQKYGDQFSSDASTRFGNQFSPSVEVASADLSSFNIGDSFTKQVESNLTDSSTGEAQPLSEPGSDEFNKELKQYEESIRKDFPGIERYGTDELDNLTEEGQKRLEDSYKIYRDYNYERNPIKYVPGVDFSKKEEKKGFGERISNLAGNIFNAVTMTQPAAASETGGSIPSGTQFSPSGDTSFSAYVRGGGEGQQRGTVTPTSPVTPRQTVASLPSDYKQTEAREFAKAAAFQQAKKNPNVTTSLDSKGQVVVKPVQKGRGESGTSDRTAQGNQARVRQNAKARAQAAAIQRKISGRSISQTKADNKAAVRKSAAERQAAFKKTGKSTVGARRAAAKKKVQAAAKKRNAAFKKRRKARRSRRGGRR